MSRYLRKDSDISTEVLEKIKANLLVLKKPTKHQKKCLDAISARLQK